MGWFILAQLFSALISMVRLDRMAESEKDFEILILRHQLDILERKQKRLVRPNRAEKLILAVLTARAEAGDKASCQPVTRCHSHLPAGNRPPLASGTGAAQVDVQT